MGEDEDIMQAAGQNCQPLDVDDCTVTRISCRVVYFYAWKVTNCCFDYDCP